MTYYEQIKDKLINNEITKRVKDYSKNRSDLETYYNVGKLIVEAQGGDERAKYGDNLIKEYSKRLTLELGKGYTFTALSRMRQFYLMFKNVATPSQHLTWSHYVELLKLNDIEEINYYINISVNQNLSVRELRNRVNNKEYERLSENTKSKLISKEQIQVEDFIKNPIVIKNIGNYRDISEKILKKLIIEDIESFLTELGEGFSFIKSEYKIKIGDRYNYIDLLLFNYIYNCFIVVELKVTELKKDHIGQIKLYMNYIDKNIRMVSQNNTIGIIILKKGNNFIMEYIGDNSIFETEFILN